MKLGHGNMAKVISGPIVNNRIANSCDDSFLDIMKLGLILFVKNPNVKYFEGSNTSLCQHF